MLPSAVGQTQTTAASQQLQMQLERQHMQNQHILQALQQLVLLNADRQRSGTHAAILEGLAAHQQQCLQPTTTSMPPSASQAQALVPYDQPCTSRATADRREIPLLKTLTSMHCSGSCGTRDIA